MLLARALEPGMLERGSGHLVFVASLSGKSATPADLRSTTRPSSACAASPSACAPTSARAASASRSSPRGRSAKPACTPTPAPTPLTGLGTGSPQQVGAAVVKAIEQNKVEVAVAPLQQRFLAHFALASPGIAVKIASGARRPEGGRGRRRRPPKDKR